MRNKRLIKLLAAAIVLNLSAGLHGSVNSKVNNIIWGKAAFSKQTGFLQSTLYLGADHYIDLNPSAITDVQKASSLSRAYLGTDAGVTTTVKVDPIAPATKCVVNKEEENISPFNDKKITNLTSYKGFPVATVENAPALVYLLTKTDGSAMITNRDTTPADVAVADADSAAVTNDVRALAVDQSTARIFAAVPQNGTTWDDVAGIDRGIAVLKPAKDNNSLDVYQASDFKNIATTGSLQPALKLDLTKAVAGGPATPANPVAFADAGVFAPIGGAQLGANVELFWDGTLQRLYIGMENVQRNDPALEGGVLGLVMGRIDPNAGTLVEGKKPGGLVLQPVVNGAAKAYFYNAAAAASINVNDRIVGFYYDGSVANAGHVQPAAAHNGDDPVNVSIRKIRVMHTSTGRNYLIVHSTLDTVRGVFALPVWPNDGVAANADKVGTIVKVDNNTIGAATLDADKKFQEVTALVDVPKADQTAVAVGSMYPENISDLFVEGDTVYMALNGNTNANSGIFYSTALFNSDGLIRGWTPAKRVMGQVGRVVTAGLDVTNERFYALTSETIRQDAPLAEGASPDPLDDRFLKNTNTVRVSDWGRTDDVKTSNLSTVLATLFPADRGGIVGMYSFGPDTSGFRVGGFISMLVVLGTDRLAIIQTGKREAGRFIKETDFRTAETADLTHLQNVFVFNAATIPALAAIAPFTCAEVSRMNGDDQGWLFIGGYKGVAVLSNDTDAAADDALANAPDVSLAGRGWPSSANGTGALANLVADGATQNEFPGGTHWTFKKLDPTTNNPGITFGHTRKLVASNGWLYVMTIDNGLHAVRMIPGTFALGNIPVAGGDFVSDPSLPVDALLADLVVLSTDANTNNDRFVVATDRGVYASDFVTPAVLVADASQGLVTQLQALGSGLPQGAPQASITTANVYALVPDFGVAHNDKVYRLDVPVVKPVALANMVKAVAMPNDTAGVVREFNGTKQAIDVDGTQIYSTLPKYYDQDSTVTLYNVFGNNVADVTGLLNITVDDMLAGVMREEAWGTVMVPGAFGVRVNE